MEELSFLIEDFINAILIAPNLFILSFSNKGKKQLCSLFLSHFLCYLSGAFKYENH